MELELKDMIRVLIVEDSPSVCKVLASILNSDPQIVVVGTAQNGKEAVEIVPKLKPDLITMDVHMPVMDGFEATKKIMAYNPTPILIISASVLKVGMDKVFKAISYGALDVVDKSAVEISGNDESRQQLIEKTKFLSGIKVIHHPLAKLEKKQRKRTVEVPEGITSGRMVAVVASTGGPQALLQILKGLPKEFPCGMVVVQHIATGFVQGLVEWLDHECQVKVKVARDSEETQQGVVYVAPCGFQMRVTEGGKISLSDEAPCDGQKPSGNILLESVARAYRKGAIGVILTGMGKDGVVGMKAVKQMGGQTIGQDEKSCAVFGMPKAAMEMGIVDKALPLEEIAGEIGRMLQRQVRLQAVGG